MKMHVISHITIGTNDIRQARRFYDPLFDLLGWQPVKEDLGEWMGWTPAHADHPMFVVTLPLDENPATVGNGSMVALNVPDRDTVRRGHALALGLGGTDEGAPGPRPNYHPNYFGAYLRDPDGNKLCLCCHVAEDG